MRCVALLFAFVAFADSASAQPEQAPVCLHSVDIDHTKAPNDHTILFLMKDGKVWSTTLRSGCPELMFNGFDYAPTPRDKVCANMQTIRVLKSDAICEIGPLVPVARFSRAPAGKPGIRANVVVVPHEDVH